MAVEDVVSVDWLDENKDSVVLLDATYELKPKPDYKEFKENYYGKFEELMNVTTNFTKNFEDEHIPGATLFNIDAAYYPSQYIRFDLYPPEEFQKYVRLLGVKAGDHIVIYGRGGFAGMLWAARVWWTFKVYGHENVSVLQGGLAAWKKALKNVTDEMPPVTPGDWEAKELDKSLLITYEELDEKRPGKKSMFENLSKINYLDARPADLFNGDIPLDIPAEGANGNHLKGAKNVPLSAVTDENGIKSSEEIENVLKEVGFDPSLPTVTACNGGVQASLLSLVLKRVGKKSRVYNGSMYEIALRSPQMISEKKDSPRKSGWLHSICPICIVFIFAVYMSNPLLCSL